MPVNEETGELILEEGKTLRFVIKGNHEGHQVDMYLYDEDFEKVSNGGDLLDIEVGAIQFAIAQLHDHGVTPYQRSSGASFTPVGESAGSSESQGFTCKFHGNKYIKDNPFEKGLKQCGIFEEVTDLNNKPEWARDKPSNSKGKWFWNCKYKEWKDK